MWWGECMCRLPTPGRLLLLLPGRVLLLLPDRVLLLLPDRVLLLVLCALVAPSAASGGRASDGERHCAGIWSDDVIYEVRHQGAGPPRPDMAPTVRRCASPPKEMSSSSTRAVALLTGSG